LSQRKFGGSPDDYYAIHKFIDSSKFFFHHVKRRLLLHNLYGIELAIELFGDYIKNSDGRVVLVRDIAAEHCKEDLSGVVPTLYDWLKGNDADFDIQIPNLEDQPKLKAFIMRPFLRTGLKSSLMLTCSDFGVYMVELLLGNSAALILAERLAAEQKVKKYLLQFKFTERWQYTPDRKELIWLKEQEA